jgi:hypothetical protein
MANYDGLTRNTWTGTWSPSGDHPIVLDTEIRGSLRYVSGNLGDQLEDISGQRLQEGMLVYLKYSYSNFAGDKYYKYTLDIGEERNSSTGDLPNSSSNWVPAHFGGDGFTTGEGIQFADDSDGKTIIGLTETGVAAGTYGSFNTIPIIRVDEYGRIEHATNIALNFNSDSDGAVNELPKLPIEVLNPTDLSFSGLTDTLSFADYNIGTIVSYFIKDQNGGVVSVDVTIGAGSISFRAEEDLSSFDFTITYILDESVRSDSYKYIMSGNSYALKHNGIDNLINFYVLDPAGNVVDTKVNLTDSDLTVESNYSLDGHSLYVISKY